MLKDVNSTTQDISTRLNVVETKVGAGGVSNGGVGGFTGGGGGGAPAAATSFLAATLEQMRVMLRQQGSSLSPFIFLVYPELRLRL